VLCEGGASSACVGVLRVQRGEWEHELGLNRIKGREGGEMEGCGGWGPSRGVGPGNGREN
jgi:hypothetical protein